MPVHNSDLSVGATIMGVSRATATICSHSARPIAPAASPATPRWHGALGDGRGAPPRRTPIPSSGPACLPPPRRLIFTRPAGMGALTCPVRFGEAATPRGAATSRPFLFVYTFCPLTHRAVRAAPGNPGKQHPRLRLVLGRRLLHSGGGDHGLSPRRRWRRRLCEYLVTRLLSM